MDDDRPWQGEEASARADLTFPPVGTAIAVFLAVAAPICFLGIAREGGTNAVVVALGIVVGTVVAVAARLAPAPAPRRPRGSRAGHPRPPVDRPTSASARPRGRSGPPARRRRRR